MAMTQEMLCHLQTETFLFIFLFFLSPNFIVSSVAHHPKALKLPHTSTATSSSSSSSVTLPTNFLFGTASSAYQYEGAYLADGKGLNNWDAFTHRSAGKITDKSNGDIAIDHYHRYLCDPRIRSCQILQMSQGPDFNGWFRCNPKYLNRQEDIDLMADLGLNSYRFSISWARILPRGRYGEINLAGIRFYNELIDALLLKGIQPFVTLCHFDIPQELEDKYGGWISPQLQEDFAYYANVCFKYFGDRVKNWVTFNEPNVVADYGYRTGQYPPGRCSASFGNCSEGDSEKEPFIAAHNIILAHGATVNLYKSKYQQQGGLIGIVLHALWLEPLSDSPADKFAVERAQSFFMNWFLDPIIFGEYPDEMRMIIGPNLPRFSEEEKKMLNKATDFIGINHYTSFYVQDCMFSKCKPGHGASWSEGSYLRTPWKNGVPIGEPTPMNWLYIHPLGMEKIVMYVKGRYNNTPIFLTENGYAQWNNQSSSTDELLNDFKRVEYMAGYLDSLLRTIRKGADVRGYFAWSLLDNFEWLEGYTKRFGLYHVDYATLKRSPKLSVSWYKEFIAKHKTNNVEAERK